MIRAAVFDFGETLLSEERAWGAWADWLGVPRAGALRGARRGRSNGATPHDARRSSSSRPGFDLTRALAERDAAGVPRHEELYDVYPDAAGALERLRAAGIAVGAAGNQPAGAEAVARRRCCARASSSPPPPPGACWKPDPAFFTRIADGARSSRPSEIAYVGDRVDFDIVPAAAVGMFTVHLRRGPWGVIHAAWDESAAADVMPPTNLDEAVDAILGSSRWPRRRPSRRCDGR